MKLYRLFPKLLTAILLCLWFGLLFHLRYHLYLIGQIPMLDFDVYHFAAHAIFLGGEHPFSIPVMQTSGPPLVILPFLPFAFLPLPLARGFFTALNLLMLWLTSYLLSRHLFPQKVVLGATVITLLFTLIFPVRFTLEMGQWNLFLMFCATLLLLKPHLYWVSPLMTVIKTNFLLTFTGLTRPIQRKALIILALIIVFAFPLITPRFYHDYFSQRFTSTVFSPVTLHSTDYYNQSFKSTLARFHLEKWYILLFIPLALLALTSGFHAHNPAAVILLSLLLSPIVWQHYVVVTYPILLLTAFQHRHHFVKICILICIAFLLTLNLPQINFAPLTKTTAILASHYFFGLVLLYVWQLKLPLSLQIDKS